MSSCSESYKDSYDLVEIKSLESMKIVIYNDSVNTTRGKFPIVKLKTSNHSFDVYYPHESNGGVIRYYKLNPYK